MIRTLEPRVRTHLVALAAAAAAALVVAGCASSRGPVAAGVAAAGPAVEPAWAPDPSAADLSICSGGEPLIAADPVDPMDFAERLHGTWELKTRTIQGLTIDTNSKFWFDLRDPESDRALGTAMLVDYGNLSILDPQAATRACPADATVSAFWEVRVERLDDRSLALRMDGEYFGSYGDFLEGIDATESASFYRYGDQYLAGKLVSPAGGQGAPDDVWDRISLRDGVLTYVSCTGRFIDRYVKRSEVLEVDGRSLREVWERRKSDGTMLEPIPVVPWWQVSALGAGE